MAYRQGPALSSYNLEALTAGAAIKAGTGVLHLLTINTKGASSNVVTLYDGVDTTGTKIATIDTTVNPGSFLYDVQFTAGLYITSVTGTAAKITVSYS